MVTRDKDFRSSLDSKKAHPVLEKEWKEEGGREIYIYQTLNHFLKNDFPADFPAGFPNLSFQDEFLSVENT